MVVSVLTRFLRKAKIPFGLKEVQDVSTLLSEQVESVPAIQMNEEPIVGLQSNGSFNTSLRQALDKILKSENYGDMTKYIIPVDFSDSSINALIFGHRLATDTGAVSKAIHVVDDQLDPPNQTNIHNKLSKIVESVNKDWASDLLKASFISSEIRMGNPVEKTLHSIEDNAGELVVVGTKQDDVNDIKWFGSVAVELMTLSPCPVLMVPESARYKGIHKVLFAIDNCTIDHSYIDTLVQFCLPLGAEIHCVYVSKTATKVPINLSRLTESYPDELLNYASVFHINIASGLQKYAESNNIDLIAVIPSSKTIFKHFMSNNISRQLANINKIPTLVVK